MNLIEKINLISKEAKNQFKPDLIKYGKNFRAISESAVLDVLSPLFQKYGVAYDVSIKASDLRVEKIKAGRDQAGNLIEKLVFVANAIVCLDVYSADFNYDPRTISSSDKPFHFEGWGSGVDSGDKATGKAITAAVKYALFKGFRLQYSDDPDAEYSSDIESIVEEKKSTEKISGDMKKESSNKDKKKDEPLASEGQLNYIKGLAVELNLSDEDFKKKFGFFPYDTSITMRKAREVLEALKKEKEDYPFN